MSIGGHVELTGAFDGDREVPRLSDDGNQRRHGEVIMAASLQRNKVGVNGGNR